MHRQLIPTPTLLQLCHPNKEVLSPKWKQCWGWKICPKSSVCSLKWLSLHFPTLSLRSLSPAGHSSFIFVCLLTISLVSPLPCAKLPVRTKSLACSLLCLQLLAQHLEHGRCWEIFVGVCAVCARSWEQNGKDSVGASVCLNPNPLHLTHVREVRRFRVIG